MKYKLSFILIALFMVTACTGPQWVTPVYLLGDPAPISYANRTIVLTAATKYVNVIGGQIVRFVNGDNSFAWNFDSSEYVTNFDLARVAPAGTLDHAVIAYIAPNPMYLGEGQHGHGHGGHDR